MTLYPIILGLVNTTMGEGIGGVPYTVPGQCWVNCVCMCVHIQTSTNLRVILETHSKHASAVPGCNRLLLLQVWWKGLRLSHILINHAVKPHDEEKWPLHKAYDVQAVAVLCGNINKVSVGPIWHFVRNKIRGGSKISLNKKDHLQQISYIKLIGTALHVFGIFMSENKNHVLSK